MKHGEISIKALTELGQAAREFIPYLKNSKIVAFYGEMGAGKTTFIKAICSELGVIDTVNSPSFAIINEYFTLKNDTIYHIDLYRLKKVEELHNIGYEDYINSSHFCFIEWPEKAEESLPENRISVHIQRNADNSRTLSIEFPGN